VDYTGLVHCPLILNLVPVIHFMMPQRITPCYALDLWATGQNVIGLSDTVPGAYTLR